MSLMEAVKSVFRNYANFNGRARRSEYWKFFLFNVLFTIIGALLGTIIGAIANDPGVGLIVIWGLLGLYSLATILPGLAVMCRRLHDVGKSGAYIFFSLLPIIGEILLWVWAFQDGQPWINQYGPDPKGRSMNPYGTPYSTASTSAYPVASDMSKESKSSIKRKCPHCNETVDADALFCPSCGRNTRDIEKKEDNPIINKGTEKHMIVCSKCGHSVGDGTQYCPYCGNNLTTNNSDFDATKSVSRVKSRGFSAPTDLD